LDAFLAEGEGEMKDGPPRQWTEAEARHLKTLVRQKSARKILQRGLAGMSDQCEEKRGSWAWSPLKRRSRNTDFPWTFSRLLKKSFCELVEV
jgi:hypothetical protein